MQNKKISKTHRRLFKKKYLKDTSLPVSIKEKKDLSVALSRDSLDEYRKGHGLNKLREKLINEISNFASFEEGVYTGLYDNLLEKDKKGAIQYLIREGVKKNRARKIVDRLSPLFEGFEDELRNMRIDIKESKTSPGELGEILYELRREINKSNKKQ